MTIKGGYILQPRCFDESEASKFPPATREIWFYILRKVNHKDNGKFKRGQGFFQFKDIQKDLQWCVGYRCETYSKPQITKALRRLREGNMIATTKETRGILITVVNYNIYQDPELYEGNGEGSTKDQRRFSKGRTINKNVKNERIKEKPPTPIGGDEKYFDMRELSALAVKHLGWPPTLTHGRAEMLRPLTQILKDDVNRGFEAAARNGSGSLGYVIGAIKGNGKKPEQVDHRTEW